MHFLDAMTKQLLSLSLSLSLSQLSHCSWQSEDFFLLRRGLSAFGANGGRIGHGYIGGAGNIPELSRELGLRLKRRREKKDVHEICPWPSRDDETDVGQDRDDDDDDDDDGELFSFRAATLCSTLLY